MKKKILIIILSVVIVAGLGVGIAALCGAFSGDDSSSTSASQSSSESSSSSSNQEEEILPSVVERVDVLNALTQNVKNVTLKDIYLLCEGEVAVVGKLLDGVTIGDLALYATGDALKFNYYDDGKWYSTDKDGKLVEFNLVLTAIFEYQIGSGEPLALTEGELMMLGNARLITYFEDQFGFKISTLIDNPPDEFKNLIPEGIRAFLSRCIALSVSDLYDLTNGDYSYVQEFIASTDVDEITNLVIEIMGLLDSSKSYVKLKNLLINMLDGNLNEVTVSESVTISSIVDAYFENVTEFSDFEWELRNQLNNIYGNKTTVGNFKDATLDLEVDVVINNISTLIKTLVSEEDKQVVEDIAKQLTDLLGGTLGDIDITVTKEMIANFIQKALGVTVEGEIATEFLDSLSAGIAGLLNGSIELLEQFTSINGELTLAEIDDYFNGAISGIVTNLDCNWEEVSSITLSDVCSLIAEFFADKNGSLDGIIEKIENANGKVLEVIEILKQQLEAWFEENKDLTVKELLADYVTIEGEAGNLKVKLTNNSLLVLDEVLLDGAIYSLVVGTDFEDLLTLTLQDFDAILSLEAGEQSLELLDNITVVEIFDLIESLSKEGSVENPAV